MQALPPPILLELAYSALLKGKGTHCGEKIPRQRWEQKLLPFHWDTLRKSLLPVLEFYEQREVWPQISGSRRQSKEPRSSSTAKGQAASEE